MKNFKMIEYGLLSTNLFPADRIMSEADLKAYIHLCSYTGNISSKVIVGHKDYTNKVCYISPDSYKSCLKSLEDKGMINVQMSSKTIHLKKVYTLPTYSAAHDNLVRFDGGPYCSFTFRREKIPFAMVPVRVIWESLALDKEEMMLLFKLYQLSIEPLFGGVDPNIIRKAGEDFFIHPRISFDLYSSGDGEAIIVEVLESLIQKGFLTIRAVSLEVELFDTERRLRLATSTSSIHNLTAGLLVPKGVESSAECM